MSIRIVSTLIRIPDQHRFALKIDTALRSKIASHSLDSDSRSHSRRLVGAQI